MHYLAKYFQENLLIYLVMLNTLAIKAEENFDWQIHYWNEQCPQLLGTLNLVIGGRRDGNSEQ